MTNIQVAGLGVALVLGMSLHALMARGPAVIALPADKRAAAELAHARDVELIRRRGAEVEATFVHTVPSILVVGDRALVVLRDWRPGMGDQSVVTTFYEYRDEQLVEVPLVSTKPKPR